MTVLRDPFFSIGGTDLSNSVYEMNAGPGADTVEVTASGDAWMDHEPGLKNWTLGVSLRQGFAAGGVDATLFPMVGTDQPIIFRPARAVRSATNPEFTGRAILTEYPILGTTVGENIDSSVSFQPRSVLTRTV